MMVLRFRVVLCGGMADDGGNFAAPSPSKRMMALRFRVVLLAEWRMTGVTLLHHHPSKRMMALRFRVVLRGGRASQRLPVTAVSDAS